MSVVGERVRVVSTEDRTDSSSLHHQPGLAPGFLACLPLFVLYEVGVFAGGSDAPRNSAERLLGLALEPLGQTAMWIRWVILALLGVLAWRRTLQTEELELPRGLLRAPIEGLVFAMVLGPLLLFLLTFFGATNVAWDLPMGRSDQAPGLVRAVSLIGAAPWEELVFRVGAYGLVYLVVARISAFFGLARSMALLLGDLFALIASSLFFAAFHLHAFRQVLGESGEAFDQRVFLWRLLAGLILAGLFRWRGLGATAWTHGLFNLALALGAGPAVFLRT